MSEMTSHTTPPTIRHPSPLEYNWTVWNHLPLPFETDWSINGYEPIISGIDTVEMAVGICKSIPPILIQKSMLYFTKSQNCSVYRLSLSTVGKHYPVCAIQVTKVTNYSRLCD